VVKNWELIFQDIHIQLRLMRGGKEKQIYQSLDGVLCYERDTPGGRIIFDIYDGQRKTSIGIFDPQSAWTRAATTVSTASKPTIPLNELPNR
jgi:hypothetical protein